MPIKSVVSNISLKADVFVISCHFFFTVNTIAKKTVANIVLIPSEIRGETLL